MLLTSAVTTLLIPCTTASATIRLSEWAPLPLKHESGNCRATRFASARSAALGSINRTTSSWRPIASRNPDPRRSASLFATATSISVEMYWPAARRWRMARRNTRTRGCPVTPRNSRCTLGSQAEPGTVLRVHGQDKRPRCHANQAIGVEGDAFKPLAKNRVERQGPNPRPTRNRVR